MDSASPGFQGPYPTLPADIVPLGYQVEHVGSEGFEEAEAGFTGSIPSVSATPSTGDIFAPQQTISAGNPPVIGIPSSRF